jgi:hypothetical protein
MVASMCTGLDRVLGHGLKLHPSGCIGGGISYRRFYDLFAAVVPETYAPILWRYAAIGTDAVYGPQVIALIVTVAILWSLV